LEANPDQKPQIYLIYSVVNTKNLLGVARMDSHYNVDDTFTYWLESNKYKGSYKIKWLFIKDVPFTRVEDYQDDELTLKNLKDGAELSLEAGKKIIQTFLKQESRPNIFDTFEYMDRREDAIRHMRDNEVYPAHSPMYKRPFTKFMGGRQYNNFRYNYNNGESRYNNNHANSGEGRFNSNTSSGSANGNGTSTRNFYNSNSNSNSNTNHYENGYKPRNYENNYQKTQDLSSNFIVRDPNAKQQKRNRGGNKKRTNPNGNSNGVHVPKEDKVDDDFWNNRSKTNKVFEEEKDVDRQ